MSDTPFEGAPPSGSHHPNLDARKPPMPAPPTPHASMFIRYVSGFGVGVAVGLSLYLGKARIPGFAPLLDLIPLTLQNTLIPLSSALMGTIAVVIQWYGSDRLTETWLRPMFGRTLLALIVSLVFLIVAHTFSVVTVPIDGGKGSVSFQVGFSRPNAAPCPVGVSDAECIKRLSFDPTKITSFWGDTAVHLGTLCTIFSYLGVTGTFGSLTGLVMLRDLIARART